MHIASGNQVTKDLTIVSDGKCAASQWQPIVPTKGSVFHDVEDTVKNLLKQDRDREWLMDFKEQRVYLSEVLKH